MTHEADSEAAGIIVSLVFRSNIESIQSLGRFGNSAQPLSCSGRSPFGLRHRQRAPPSDLYCMYKLHVYILGRTYNL